MKYEIKLDKMWFYSYKIKWWKLKSPVTRSVNITYHSVEDNEKKPASLLWYSSRITLPGSSYEETDWPI